MGLVVHRRECLSSACREDMNYENHLVKYRGLFSPK